MSSFSNTSWTVKFHLNTYRKEEGNDTWDIVMKFFWCIFRFIVHIFKTNLHIPFLKKLPQKHKVEYFLLSEEAWKICKNCALAPNKKPITVFSRKHIYILDLPTYLFCIYLAKLSLYFSPYFYYFFDLILTQKHKDWIFKTKQMIANAGLFGHNVTDNFCSKKFHNENYFPLSDLASMKIKLNQIKQNDQSHVTSSSK